MYRVVAALLAATLLLPGCALLLEPLEESLLFRQRPASPERYAAILARDPGVEEVRLSTPDGVKLHGLLKRAPAAPPGDRYPLVIVFGGVARETSWMVNWGQEPRRSRRLHRALTIRTRLTPRQRRFEGSGIVQK